MPARIELHLDLDGTGEEYHTGHCWLPEESPGHPPHP
jgi:hypothetical protein